MKSCPASLLTIVARSRRQESGKQGMIFGKAVAGRQGAHPDLRLVALCERYGFVPGIVPGHRGSDNERRAVGRGELSGNLFQQRGVASYDLADEAGLDRHAGAIPIIHGY